MKYSKISKIAALATTITMLAGAAYALPFPCPIGAPCMFTGNPTAPVQPGGGNGGNIICPPGKFIGGQPCGGGMGGNDGFVNPNLKIALHAIQISKSLTGEGVSVLYVYNLAGSIEQITIEGFMHPQHNQKDLKFVVSETQRYLKKFCDVPNTNNKISFNQFTSSYLPLQMVMSELAPILTKGCQGYQNTGNGGNTGTK